MYPMNGNVSASIGHVQASRLVLSRFAYKLHRELVSLGTMGSKGLCGKYLMPVMRKPQYRFQATNPNPATSGRYASPPRPEERRVVTECVITIRSRCSTYQYKKQSESDVDTSK